MAAGEDEKAAAKEEASMASMLQAYVFSVSEGSRECCNSFMLMLYQGCWHVAIVVYGCFQCLHL
jgi:hypothetical protein